MRKLVPIAARHLNLTFFAQKLNCISIKWLWLLIISFPFFLLAQPTISSKTFLQNQLQQVYNSSTLQLPNRAFNPAIIQEVEIRTETDEFQFNEQQYQLRFSPSTDKIITAEKELYKLYQHAANVKLAEEQQRFIIGIYQDFLRAYELQRKLDIEEQQLLVLQDLERTTKQLSSSGKISPRNWLDVQRDIMEIELTISWRKKALNILTKQQNISTEDILNVEQIVGKISTTTLHSGINSSEGIDLELLEAEIELEEAERKKVIDFLQFQYDRSPEDLLREKISVSASFRLPFYGDRKLKMEELAIEKASLAAEIESKKKWKTQQIQRLQIDLLSKYKEWKHMTMRITSFQKRVDFFIKKTNQSERTTPVLLLEERVNGLKSSLELLEIEIEVYDLYLEVLEESGALFFNAEQSWLH